MDYTLLIASLITLIGGYLSYRLGRYQVEQTKKSTELVNITTGETEFRKSLLELLDQQEEKMDKQEVKIEKQDILIEQSKALTDELKRANFHLSIENQKLTREIESLQRELSILRDSHK